jgi:hypothetical protein
MTVNPPPEYENPSPGREEREICSLLAGGRPRRIWGRVGMSDVGYPPKPWTRRPEVWDKRWRSEI